VTFLTILQRSILCAFGIAFLFAQSAEGADASFFVGNWYGVGEPDDSSISYIDSYRADGTFHSEFRKCERGEVVWHQTETGKWSLSKGVLRMVSDTINGKPERFENSYTVELAAGDEFRARLHEPGFLFIERRLPKFEFPPCYVGA
jgi:hypothetical protein